MFRYVIALALAGAAATAASAASYSIADNFGGTMFQYGYMDSDGHFVAKSGPSACDVNLSCYSDTGLGSTIKNNGITPYHAFGYYVPAGTVQFNPTLENTAGIIRFIAPEAGTYTISGSVWRNDATQYGNGTVFSLVQGSNVLLTAGLAYGSYGVSTGFNKVVVLAKDEALDFAIGSNGEYAYDSTGISALISTAAVPEPSTWAMMLAGFGLAGAALRRGRRAALA